MIVHKGCQFSLRRLSQALLLFAVLALVGCGQSKATVSGVVTYKGTPLPSGTVTFVGENKQVASGPIDANGHYTVNKVPFGTVKITVSTPAIPASVKLPEAKKGEAALPTVKSVSIPAKYSDPNKSGLTCTVTTNPQEHPIELK